MHTSCTYKTYDKQHWLLKLWVWTPLGRVVLNTTLCDQVCQWLVACRWFSLGAQVSSTNKTDCHDIAEILLEVVLTLSNNSAF
jgi:hypothetical protein